MCAARNRDAGQLVEFGMAVDVVGNRGTSSQRGSRPFLIWPSTDGMASKLVCTWPPARSMHAQEGDFINGSTRWGRTWKSRLYLPARRASRFMLLLNSQRKNPPMPSMNEMPMTVMMP